MKVSREQVAENRKAILDSASRMFRERGFEAVTVAEIMLAAGLTHGGFYGHFDSKEDLIAQTLAHAATGVEASELDLADYAAEYLSARHRDDRAGGCPVAALAGEAGRQPAAARTAMTEGLRRQIDRLSGSAPGATAEARREAAIAGWATMVGAVVLARMSEDPQLAEEVLAAARQSVGASPR